MFKRLFRKKDALKKETLSEKLEQDLKEEIKKVKSNHLARLENKENYFKCILNLDFFAEPLLTPCGHYFEKEQIFQCIDMKRTECPCCRSPNLTKEKLMLDPVMQKSVNDLKEGHKNFLEIIEKEGEIKALKVPVEMYEALLDKHVIFFQDDMVRKKRYQQLFINERVEALKLNKNNPEHLKFWQDQTKYYWQGYGTTMIDKYKVPSRIALMMEVALKPYKNKDEFLQAIELKRQPDSNRLFSYALSFGHTAITAQLYDAKDIERMDLRK